MNSFQFTFRILGYVLFPALLLYLYYLTFPITGTGEPIDSLIQSRNSQIVKLSRDRKDILSFIEELKQREWSVIEVLKVLNTNIKNNQEKLDDLLYKIDELNKSIAISDNKIQRLERDVSKDQYRIQQQVYVLFYVRRIRKMTHLVGLSSFKNYFRNQYLLQKNTEVDAAVLARLKENLSEWEKENETQKLQKQQFVNFKAESEEQNKLLSFERQQQQTYLHHIRQDRSLRMKYLREVQVELEQLNDVIHSLKTKKKNEKKTKRFQGFFRYKNALPSPVKGELVHKFGQKQSPFYTLFKKGVLIETKENQEVYSILPGKVVWSGPFHRYQNLVILDHGKGSLSVYGNLEEIFVIVNDVVDKGYALGTVAYNDVEQRYLFYFETRYNKRAVNPEQWLKKPAWQ